MKKKRKKLPKWQKELTVKERKHLKEVNVTTLKGAKRNFEAQKEQREEYPEVEPCWDCRFIARTLGCPV